MWKNDDTNGEQVKESVFRAYEHHGDGDSDYEVASITIADATLDVIEPDVSALEEADVHATDQALLEGTQTQLNAEGRTIVQWMSSRPNQTDRIKGLVTVYTVGQHDQQRLCIVLRLTSKARKIVVIGVFDIAKTDALASLIFGVMRDMVVLS